MSVAVFNGQTGTFEQCIFKIDVSCVKWLFSSLEQFDKRTFTTARN